ncbi:C-terminal binding protein AN-like isoform X2 [Magnolia sinica]|uniref:C-terminal binding protein AN-like isoform X2 n=1 Tax=Magnolia sinica TaxID=86752 RepID=UPI00265A9520|nr:C-terminal binding protein AN-like isoform X2 [Magnolia sinica]
MEFGVSHKRPMHRHPDPANPPESTRPLPLVVSLNCLEDPTLEQDSLSGLAAVEHVSLARIAEGRIESAAAVLLHSLAFLPRAAQRRLRPSQLVLCLGSSDRAVDSALAADLGLRLVHVDASRAEEVADTVMALFLGLLRRTHLLSRHAFSASGWLGSLQPLCRGMRRCRGLVLGIVGRSASARSLVTRSLAFKMSVLYFDVHEEKGKSGRHSITFPSAARRMDTLNDLLAASDLVSLHCALSNETVQIINGECLQHIKPGAFLVNTGSSQLIDDCALKQLLIDGTIAGCALDGAEGPQWMEAWVREMSNVLILPRSADYSEEVWMEIREKAVSMLQAFFFDGVFPKNDVSDEDEAKSETGYKDERLEKREKENALQVCDDEQLTDESQFSPENSQKPSYYQLVESHAQSQGSVLSQNTITPSEGRRSRSGKKGKKRPARRKSQQKSDDPSALEGDSNCTSQRDDDTAISGRDQVLSSSSRFASPEDSRNRQTCAVELTPESSSEKQVKLSGLNRKSGELLKDGFVIALHARDRPGFHVSRQRVPGGGWFLDTMSNVTKRDPAAQFLVTFRSKDTIGLRSFAAGGKLLQINRRMEFVFASHSFDVWESWKLEGSLLECRLVNCRNPLAVLDVRIEILAAVGEEDGVARWLH